MFWVGHQCSFSYQCCLNASLTVLDSTDLPNLTCQKEIRLTRAGTSKRNFEESHDFIFFFYSKAYRMFTSPSICLNLNCKNVVFLHAHDILCNAIDTKYKVLNNCKLSNTLVHLKQQNRGHGGESSSFNHLKYSTVEGCVTLLGVKWEPSSSCE